MNEDDPEGLAVAGLLARVGKRAQPPAPTRDAVYVAALVAWRQQQFVRRRRRWLNVALAASLLLVAVGIGWMLRSMPTATTLIAAHSADRAFPVGSAFEVTDPGGLRIQSQTGEQLRLRAGTRVEFPSARQIRLVTGALYVESRDHSADATSTGLTVLVGQTLVRHIGTRYIVGSDGARIEVLVRDGRIELISGMHRSHADAGTRVALSRSGSEENRGPIAAHGGLWRWAEALSPPLAIEGRYLSQVLLEIAFETGRQLQFESEAVRIICEKTSLHGPILDLQPSGRLFAVLVATGLEAVESGDRILIRQQNSTKQVSVAQ
jgi:ferric-dicitrate binding protein FerR (iron transport regulator)